MLFQTTRWGTAGWKLIALMNRHLPSTGASGIHDSDDRRDLRLDACRGLALWLVFIDHIPGNWLGGWTPRNFGFSDMTEVFVFVSGYTCMVAYGGALQSQGWQTVATRAVRRAAEIYAAFLLLLMAYFIVIWTVGSGTRYLDETNTRVFFESPGPALLHAAILQYTPVNTDILPIFVFLHLAFPLVLWLLLHNAAAALVISLLAYLAVQRFGWNLPGWPARTLYFNPLAWQILFVLGACYASGANIGLKRIVRSRAMLVLAALYLAASLVTALSWRIEALAGLMPDTIAALIYPIDKSSLAPLRLLHFLALAILVSQLVPSDWPSLMKPAMRATIRCGENSLAIYCIGVLLSFIGFAIISSFSGALLVQAAISIGGIAVMIAAANLMTLASRQDRPGPRLF